MIKCVDVHKSYRRAAHAHSQGGLDGSAQIVAALRGVDLHISEPGFYAIMGASGSGKSTLLHLLAGLDVPDRGEVHVGPGADGAGRRIDQLDDRELTRFRRHEVGIVFQQFNLIPTMTAQENVELPGMLGGHGARERGARARELLGSLGLAARADHRPEALSGGEQQRVAIARALYFAPPVLLADEPTGNLDSRSSEALWSLLRSIADERGMTVVMVTHEPAAAAHCRRAILLSDGRVSGHIETDGRDASDIAAEYQQLGRTA